MSTRDVVQIPAEMAERFSQLLAGLLAFSSQYAAVLRTNLPDEIADKLKIRAGWPALQSMMQAYPAGSEQACADLAALTLVLRPGLIEDFPAEIVDMSNELEKPDVCRFTVDEPG